MKPLQGALLGAAVILAAATGGCFPSPTEILTRSHSEWTDRDGLTVAASMAHTNAANQQENFIVTVLPLTPDVAFAFNAMNIYRRGWDSVKAKDNLDAVLKDYCGLFVDDTGVLWTPTKGRYTGVHDLDSLMFVVILRNRTYPCQAPHFNGVPLMRQADVPCDMEDISDIENRIYLVTPHGKLIKPSMVTGREKDILIYEEFLFVRFRFQGDATPMMVLFVERDDKEDITFELTLGEQ